MNDITFSNYTDQQLVEVFLQKGDELIFRKLYQRHMPALYLLALRLAGGSQSDAEDALQEMWIRACRKLPEFKWKSSLKTWLTGILINCIRENFREKISRNEEELSETAEYEKKFESLNSELEIEQIILNLPTGYRHVLILFDIEGYNHDEIANFLDINIGTSKSQLFQARRVFRERFLGKNLYKKEQ